jgi:5-methylthioadenosine/S-adenosylhomocysteine deaminase
MIRFRIAHLLTSANAAVIDDAVMDVADGKVQWVGPAAAAPFSDLPVETLQGLVTPGLINTHCHTPMLLLRGTGEGLPTDRWLTEVMWPREGRLSPSDVGTAMRLGAVEMLRNGVTTTSEMYFFGQQVAEGAREVGLRCVVSAPLIEAADFAAFGSVDEQLAAIGELRSLWAEDSLIDIGVGPHAAYSLSRQTLEKVADFVAKDPMLVHIHVAEQPHEGDEVTARSGLSVPAYLDQIGLLTSRTVAAHCVWVTEADIEVMAERKVTVAHCPVSNGRHASGIAPVTAMRAAGLCVALGTDGPASHDRIDLFEEMRTAIRYARIKEADASALGVREALEMATCGAALGREDLGRLEVGCLADFLRIDIEAPEFEPRFSAADLPEQMVWATHPERIRDVWVNGKQRVKEREVLGVDVDALRREVRERALALAAH